jgi:hypothetical protein
MSNTYLIVANVTPHDQEESYLSVFFRRMAQSANRSATGGRKRHLTTVSSHAESNQREKEKTPDDNS